MRLDIDTLREIGDSLVRNKRRSLLTGFGIFWGLFMLLFMIGGGAGFKVKMMENFQGFATNTMVVASDRTAKPWKGMKSDRYWNLSFKDVERYKALIPELDVVTPMKSMWGSQATYGDKSTNINIKGVTADHALIEIPKMKYGRFLSETDVLQERKVCVIGKRVYNELFPEGGDPCGKYIKAGVLYYKIIGVNVSTGNININGSTEQALMIPISIVQKCTNSGNDVDIIFMTGKPGVKMSSLGERLRAVTARYHLFDPTDEQALMEFNTEELFQLIDNLFKGLNILIWIVGLGTLLAGAVGVSNIMMVTVKERTIEIGIRRAIGATPAAILGQIMAESATLTLAAGSAGIVFTVLVLEVFEKASGQAIFQISFSTAVIAAVMLTVLGVLAGLAPAYKAMSIKPVDAMRDE